MNVDKIVQHLSDLNLPTVVADQIVRNTVDKLLPSIHGVFSQKIAEANSSQNELFYEINYEFNEDTLLRHVLDNITRTITWSTEISFKSIDKVHRLSDIFIDLDLFLSTQSSRFDEEVIIPTVLSSTIFHQSHHTMIVGGPGAGKTTLLKKMCSNFYREDRDDSDYSTAISIRFREVKYPSNKKEIESFDLYQLLCHEVGLNFDVNSVANKNNVHSRDLTNDLSHHLRRMATIEFLNTNRFIVVLDGIDEIPSKTIRQRIINDLDSLSLSLYASRLIVTSRTGEFEKYFEHIRCFEICGLTGSQIEEFVHKWIPDRSSAKDLLR